METEELAETVLMKNIKTKRKDKKIWGKYAWEKQEDSGENA